MQTIDAASLLAEPAPLCWDRLTATNAPLATGADTADDPLDLALPWLVRHLGVAQALEAALAPEDDLPPAHSARLLPALKLIGWDARLVRCASDELARAPLPALLLLRCGDACVLTRLARPKGRSGPWLAHVVMPGQPPLAFEVPLEVLAREYTGMALLVQPAQAGALAPPPPQPQQGPLARLAIALQAALAVAPAGRPGGRGGWLRAWWGVGLHRLRLGLRSLSLRRGQGVQVRVAPTDIPQT